MDRLLIWGTNISADDTYTRFQDFVRNYRDAATSEHVFMTALERVRRLGCAECTRARPDAVHPHPTHRSTRQRRRS
jgi:hypothetical protein